ncbi:Uncharacterised protein [Bacteroides faecis]|uniref:Uncharacterized protein n=1 Tax=Bacteroides faecis TaxID=674529 RepID=A0A174M415_9BACE|nr:Uncharacterised protein [Bacteroides faecis]
MPDAVIRRFLHYLLIGEVLVAQFEGDNETAAFARFAFYPNGAVMEFDNTFGQCQSDTGSGSRIQGVQTFGLIETVEYLIYFSGSDARARIFYFDNDRVVLLRYVDGDGVFRLCMLQCVRQQIVHYLLHLLLVVPYFNIIRLFVELEVDLLAAGVFQK